MRINKLYIKNIGPFKEAELEFANDFNTENGAQPVTIITGVNGAGKSIVIDAIRASLTGQELERHIVADDHDFQIKMEIDYDGTNRWVSTSKIENGAILEAVDFSTLARFLRSGYKIPGLVYDWVIDYWSANSPTDEFKIKSMTNIQHEKVFENVMSGKKSNIQLVNFICQIDYLRSSDMPSEKELGEVLYEKLKEVVNLCLDNGSFKYVRRTDLTPMVEQNGIELSLEKLSSGNIFLLEHLLLFMQKMYSVSVLNKLPANQVFKSVGLLLIDEIETHLHPKWQKKILGIIRTLFPNIQIILTTHSPFVVASMDGARIYTCVPQTGYSEICDETEKYGRMPVEDILMSDVFGVHPFNDQITEMIRTRKQLIEKGDMKGAQAIADELYEINPEYFSYLKGGW